MQSRWCCSCWFVCLGTIVLLGKGENYLSFSGRCGHEVLFTKPRVVFFHICSKQPGHGCLPAGNHCFTLANEWLVPVLGGGGGLSLVAWPLWVKFLTIGWGEVTVAGRQAAMACLPEQCVLWAQCVLHGAVGSLFLLMFHTSGNKRQQDTDVCPTDLDNPQMSHLLKIWRPGTHAAVGFQRFPLDQKLLTKCTC